MLRIIVDSIDKIDNEFIDDVNIQYMSIETITKDSKALLKFLNYIDRYLSNGDKVIIISLFFNKVITSTFENGENIRVINSLLPEKGINMLIQEILKYKNESLDFIEKKITYLVEVFDLCFYLLTGC